jgi:pyruvate dehydrogenase E2 component (dihydrolipoyllysine-residue acetyltransferase)
MAEVINMPKLGFDMAEGTLVRWVVNEGEPITKGAVLAEIETDKATVEVESTQEGVVLRHLVSQGTVVPINTPIAVIGKIGEEVNVDSLLSSAGSVAAPESTERPAEKIAERVTSPPPTPLPEVRSVPGLPEGVRASPLARHMAQEKGIDLHRVIGSGPGGRVTKADIEAYLAVAPEQVQPPPPGKAPISVTTPISTRESSQQPLPRLRAAIGRRMFESTQQIPHFYVTHEYDVEALIELRKQLNALLPEDDKISVNDFIVKAVALALREFPNLNASLDLKNEMLLMHGQINVGVAVAVDNGLLTVVNRDTDQKSLHQIASEVRSMVSRARGGKVRPDEIEGSTFTVSNLGMFNVDQFTAIINPPEAAILAVGSVNQVPVVVNGEIKVGMRMKATLSVDHRISDGAEGARFLQTLASYLEQPLRLLL